MSGKAQTIRVSPEQKAKALRDAARNSKVRIVRITPSQRGSTNSKPA